MGNICSQQGNYKINIGNYLALYRNYITFAGNKTI